jgi:N6-L-threonylcarbamoyladenine synthase
MKVLAIETSCDETGIALVEGRRQGGALEFAVLKAELLSQAKLHAEYGGVFPTLAKREHAKNLPVLFERFAREQFDAVAVTAGPGLEPALWTGIEFARHIADTYGVPLLPVNHMEGHIVSSLARPDEYTNKLEFISMFKIKDLTFPILALLISGGHTELVLTKDWFAYEMLGKTLDDAVGEAFDKVARMLNLPYPGGPEISKLAAGARKKLPKKGEMNTTPTPFSETFSPPKLPRPMLNADSCDMSFSGLKTAALYALRDRGGIQKLSADEVAAFAAEFEDAVAEVLCAKVRRALNESGAKTFVIGGGVAANRYIREELQKMISNEFPDVGLRLPHLSITGDNAIMIAEAALTHLLLGDWQLKNTQEIAASGNLSLAQKVL